MNKPNLEDLLTAAQTIVMEARNEPYLGRVAVAWVMRHRLERQHYFKQSTLWGVCHAPYQFSCWGNYPDKNLELVMLMPFSHPTILDALAILIRVFAGLEKDESKGADHYYADGIPAPNWTYGQKETIKIGHHHFYKLASDI